MTTPQRTPSLESSNVDSNIRKRVCKACDRCRLKKSKCDGANPCSRCQADNAICVFGERKKSHDKIYPKGYVEMLEQQQAQLVSGLRELYRLLQSGKSWPGEPLKPALGGHPLTHDILERLDLLHPSADSPESYDSFEEDPARMQKKLVEHGAPYTSRRRGSISSDGSEQGHASSSSSHGTPPTRTASFERFPTHLAPPTPTHSPFPRSSGPATIKSVAVSASNFFDPAQFNVFDASRPWGRDSLAIDELSMNPFNFGANIGAPYDQNAMSIDMISPTSMSDPTLTGEVSWPDNFAYPDYLTADRMVR